MMQATRDPPAVAICVEIGVLRNIAEMGVSFS
jgi:hypothetical protein